MVSELLKYITIRVISGSSECRWRHQRHGKTQKTQKGKEKARKPRQVRKKRATSFLKLVATFRLVMENLFQPNALQKWHPNCLGVCISICAHHSRVIETTHWHWLCLLHFPTLLLWSTGWDETPVLRPAFFVSSVFSRNGKRWPEVDERLEGQLW